MDLSSHKPSSKIHQILVDANLSYEQKLDMLMALLSSDACLDLETFQLIDISLKGPYGSEYLLIQNNLLKLREFYQFLSLKHGFPEILLSLADLLLLDEQYSESFNSFNQAFFYKPLLIFKAPGELTDLLEEYGNSEQKLFYHLSLIRALIEDGDMETAYEEYQDIIQQYGNENFGFITEIFKFYKETELEIYGPDGQKYLTSIELSQTDSDGKPMADNTEQYEWIVKIKENLEILFYCSSAGCSITEVSRIISERSGKIR